VSDFPAPARVQWGIAPSRQARVKRPELLSPAGTLRNMRYAFAYGADAVYAGMPRYSLRVRNNDFLEENLRIGIDEAQTPSSCPIPG